MTQHNTIPWACIYIFLFAFFMNFQAFGQDSFCNTTKTEHDTRSKYPELGSLEELYSWYETESKKLKERGIEEEFDVQTIPIIFHIIHDGESIGDGDNISTEHIHAQLKQLNNDFRRKYGTSGWNHHDDGADTKIEFCLAGVDTLGSILPERGINRIDRNEMGWIKPFQVTYSYIESTIKPTTQWDPTQYVNIWLLTFQDGPAYARYPVMSGLGNILSGNSPANTDGIVIKGRLIGSTDFLGNGYTPNFNYAHTIFGRALTHEMGHFLGLAHIWGEYGGCGSLGLSDDGCTDTPRQASSHLPDEDCPSFNSCPDDIPGKPDKPDMTENYMSYAHGLCKNVFTNDQVIRMKTTLANSPRRKELVNSSVCQYYCQPEWSGTISKTTTWSDSSPNLPPNDGVAIGKIYIENGATLDIKTDITFGSGGEIYIKPGGTLKLSGKLTACDRWNGIRIYGNDGKKGKFIGENGAIIEHAVWGIATTDGKNYLGQGEITCNGVFFRNNAVAAMIGTKNGIEFAHKNYNATFTGCRFENNNQLRHEKFWAFITTYNLDGVKVYASKFINKQTNSTYSNPYNAGIVALNGNVQVQAIPSNQLPPSYFEGLYFGIEARAFGANLNFKVWKCVFRDCKIGILNSGYTSPYIVQNHFDFQKIFSWNGEYKGAIYLEDGMQGITVQDNTVQTLLPSYNPNTHGIYINSIGPTSNTIRRNTFINRI